MTRSLWLALLVVGAGTLAAQAAPATASAGPQWTAWLGCWEPTANGNTSSAVLTCIVPSKDQAGVQRLTVVGDSIASRETLVADGKPRPAESDGCKGEENVSWSKVGTRVYLNGHFVCPVNLDVQAERMYAMAPGGEWVEEEQLRSGGGVITRETRYRDAGLPASLPKSISRALQGRSLPVTAARAAASAPPTGADVADAVSFVDSSMVRAWLTQTGTHLGGSTIFASGGESGSAYAGGTTIFAPPAGSYNYGSSGAVIGPYSPPSSAPMAPMQTGLAPYCIATGCYVPNPASPFDAYVFYPSTYPNAYGYGYSPFAYGYPYGYWLTAPVIVTHPGVHPRAPEPRAPAKPGIRR